ncbi:MAG: discoidin domain-containing protein [Ardenticatenales bacterium]|nr:discoidin domain-containing protein [Ardenticatenales bacterium]
MSRFNRFIHSVSFVAAVAATAGLVLATLAPMPPAGAAPANAPMAAPMQQAVQATGIVTTGVGVCFPDAVLLDCTGAVVEQLKGPGGSGSFAAFYGQWVEVSGTRVACTGGTYLNVVSIQNQTNPCPNGTTVPGQATATATAVPPPTATPLPGVPTATPVGGASGSDNLAFGRTIVASSSQPGFPPENAVDADPNTPWSSQPGSDPFYRSQNIQWIYVDLGADTDVASIQTLWGPQRHARGYSLYQWIASANAWRQMGSTNYGTGNDTWTIRGGGSVRGRYFMLYLANPYLSGGHYELRDWIFKGPGATAGGSGPTWENVARGKTVSAEHETPGFPAASAVDGDVNTQFETARLPGWIYVDLGTTTTINRVILRWAAGKHASAYILYAWNGSTWAGLYERRNATGGDETIDLRAFNTRYLLLSATAGPATTVALREFEILRYTAGSSGGSITPPTPTVPAPPPPPLPLGGFELRGAAGRSAPGTDGFGVGGPSIGPVQLPSGAVPAPVTAATE